MEIYWKGEADMRNKPIRVTFKDNDLENELYDDIMKECTIIGQSTWMKQAAIEKLERDKSKVQSTQSNNSVINSLDDLFK